MRTTGSVTRVTFDTEYQDRIALQRNFDLGLFAAMDFLSAVSTSLAIMDLAGMFLTMESFLTTFPFMTSFLIAFPFIGIAVAIGCGAACAYYVIKAGLASKNREINLMQECEVNTNKILTKLPNLIILLDKLLTIDKDERLKSIKNKIVDQQDLSASLKELRGYFRLQKETHFRQYVIPKQLKAPKPEMKMVAPPSHMLSHFIAFFSGAGLMLGACISIMSAFALFTPFGLAIAALLILAAGVGMVYADYRAKQAQDSHIQMLEQEKFSSFILDKQLGKTIRMTEDYTINLSLRPQATYPNDNGRKEIPPTLPAEQRPEIPTTMRPTPFGASPHD